MAQLPLKKQNKFYKLYQILLTKSKSATIAY